MQLDALLTYESIYVFLSSYVFLCCSLKTGCTNTFNFHQIEFDNTFICLPYNSNHQIFIVQFAHACIAHILVFNFLAAHRSVRKIGKKIFFWVPKFFFLHFYIQSIAPMAIAFDMHIACHAFYKYMSAQHCDDMIIPTIRTTAIWVCREMRKEEEEKKSIKMFIILFLAWTNCNPCHAFWHSVKGNEYAFEF